VLSTAGIELTRPILKAQIKDGRLNTSNFRSVVEKFGQILFYDPLGEKSIRI